ncbi:DUF3105 domain-containing protein [Glaciihabitans sp. UYNi722]|uniref:DUF3105 domain-containing protein n=1 Tax=Glaciihabitans sp. UYNi722 TaxID=3156344 RepID=UPI003395FD65
MDGSNGTGAGRSPARAEQRQAGSSATARPTIKEQRKMKRAGKVAALKRQQAKADRNRRVAIVLGGTVAVAAVVAVIAFVVLGGTAAGPTSTASIKGVQTFTGVTAKHVDGTVNYQQTPPVGGDHSSVPLNCAVYADPVPNENAVHSLEHGSVWVTYDPAVISGANLDTLRKRIPATYAILSPYPGLPTPVVASAWGAQLKVNRVTDPRISEFVAKYKLAKTAPEPGAPCTGGIDGPGKLQ